MDLLSFQFRSVDNQNNVFAEDISSAKTPTSVDKRQPRQDASKSDDDSFSKHMKRDGQKDNPADEQSSTNAKQTDSENVSNGETKEQKRSDGEGTPQSELQKSGFAAINIQQSKNDTAKQSNLVGMSFTKQTAALATTDSTVEAVTVGDDSSLVIELTPTSNLNTGVISITPVKNDNPAEFNTIRFSAGGKTEVALTDKQSAKTLVDQSLASKLSSQPLSVIGLDEATIEVPSDLTIEETPIELPEIELSNLSTFKSVKTNVLASQYTVSGPATAFSQSLTDSLSVVDGEPELKPLMTSGDMTATMRANLVTTQQPVTAAVATAATAQLVAAVKTEPKSRNIELRLDPPELGRVRISLSVETADAVKAVLTVERPETLEHLRRNMSQFTEGLREAGFNSVDVEFSENSGSDFQDEASNPEHENIPSYVQETAADNIVYLSLRDNAQLDLLV